jgi:hypothetical protein
LALAHARGLRAHAWRITASHADWLLATGQAGVARDQVLALIA